MSIDLKLLIAAKRGKWVNENTPNAKETINKSNGK